MRRARIIYSDAEMTWLEQNREMIISDYHSAFQKKFRRPDVLLAHLHGLRKRKGWKVGREAGRYKGRRRLFSEAEIQWLRENCTLPTDQYAKQFNETFGRTDMTEAKLHSMRKREGWRTGRSGRFEKGRPSPNKGKRCPPGTGGRHPNARKTQFKKGQVPHNAAGPGHEWLDQQSGYIVMLVDEPNPWKPDQKTRPVHKHRWLWEKANGPVPEGQVLKCLDGDKANCDPSNWQPVPREILPHLNGRFGMGYDQAEPEVKPTIMAVARLKHAARNAKARRAEA
ncbi:HNH endonuclease signature motif containing protein [Rhizobium halophilum]|uniref:HNH endonuclease signature motif containing protein n=1 Tax=Rhizobium halophilum TaxID=2846852 RepID=UPI001EFE9AB7|nr:HNH endonuclease signature motif containing protein [Rhizobium halophilum]MCF6368316.1 HNH endonuclease [Rhizobium halophilum]